jgi:hypothetical protein
VGSAEFEVGPDPGNGVEFEGVSEGVCEGVGEVEVMMPNGVS